MSAAIDLSGKSVVVTGASMGIGEVVARTCLTAGARVTICSRDASGIAMAVRRLEAIGAGEIAGIAADVSDRTDVGRLFDEAQRRFGGVDGVVHGAAVLGAIGSILDVDPEEWRRTVEIDLFGTFLVTREACTRMRERGCGGRIVLFSGGGAAAAFPNFTAYACSKVAVVRFAETVAVEIQPFGIEINALGPGVVATRMVEQIHASGKNAGTPMNPVPAELGAEAAAFLISDAARGITGKFVAAAYDNVHRWNEHLDELRSHEIFTLRRILPKERGMQWQ